ncbi:hypothetical protein D9613_002677 [Agrocybe pediades]|uniref:Hydrophobin n=1 Tax=Agrocybe pediades TaxID=84607 RepID=A0A8H4VMU3_9AGAR|nr:hypothetical protein D9613_002677 [Agrocybe pediades]KAF9564420.1 fungal hydrophobin [Agrocybe pediades]
MVSFKSLFVLSLSAIAFSSPLVGRTDSNPCNSGSLSCCNEFVSPTSSGATAVTGLLGIVLQGLDGLVGLQCTNVLVAGTSCQQQTACCTGNTFNGLVALGCNPIGVGL